MPKVLRRLASDPARPKVSDFWRTPYLIFAALHLEFDFDLDLAATATDCLVDRWLGPGGLADDALAAEWTAHGRRGFCNPPYSSALIKAFMAKGAQEAGRGFTSVFLVPYTVDPVWWQWTQYATEIREIPHRVPYLRADGVTRSGAMFGSAIVVFRPQPGIVRGSPRHVVWTYRPEGSPYDRRQ